MMRPWRRTPRYHDGPMRFSCTSVNPASVNHCGWGGTASRWVRWAAGLAGGAALGPILPHTRRMPWAAGVRVFLPPAAYPTHPPTHPDVLLLRGKQHPQVGHGARQRVRGVHRACGRGGAGQAGWAERSCLGCDEQRHAARETLPPCSTRTNHAGHAAGLEHAVRLANALPAGVWGEDGSPSAGCWLHNDLLPSPALPARMLTWRAGTPGKLTTAAPRPSAPAAARASTRCCPPTHSGRTCRWGRAGPRRRPAQGGARGPGW